MEEKLYIRNCPKCGKELKTKNKYWYKKVIVENRMCGSCGLKGNPKSPQAKFNMSKNHADVSGDKNPFYNKKHTEATIQLLSENQKNRLDNTYRKILSESMKEWHKHNDNSFKGKVHSDETKKQLSLLSFKRFESQEERYKISNLLLGNVPWNAGKLNVYSDTTLIKMRTSAIKRIEDAKFNGGQMAPNYNISSIPILEQKAKELGITDLQHAENSGEYHIKELGYWVDGYSKEKNIVLEYYENHHKRQTKKDLQRQKEITNLLKCEFIIIKE